MKPYHLCPLLLVAVLSATSYTRAEIRTTVAGNPEPEFVATWSIHRDGRIAGDSYWMFPIANYSRIF